MLNVTKSLLSSRAPVGMASVLLAPSASSRVVAGMSNTSQWANARGKLNSGLDGCRHVLRILAPIAQWTDFSADRNRDHFSAGLPQGAQGSLLRGVMNDDAVQLARVGSEPFLDLALRNLVRPHPSERTHHL